jgi:NitT/TauT family transport system substrate-binding protein
MARMGNVSALSICFGGVLMVAAVSAGPASAQQKPWRHGILEPKSDAGFILMAERNGFAAKHGLNLQLVPLKNETLALRALIAGDLESYEGTPPFAAVARGSDAKVIGCYWVGLPHALFVRDGINSVKELAGKTIASSAQGSLPDLVARATFGHFKVPAADVTFANVGSDSDRYRALTSGVVDATVVSSEYTPTATAQKLHVLVQARDILPDFMRLCYHSSSKVLADRPDDAARFLATETEALKFALSHRDETIKLTKEAAAQKPEDPRAAFVYDDVINTHSIDPDLPIPLNKIESMQQILLTAGITPKAIDVKTMVDPAPRARALTVK